jgi:hypothetical protein
MIRPWRKFSPSYELKLNKERNMFRKTILALAATGALALGMTSMANTASADVHFGFGFGYPGYGYGLHHGYGWRHRYFAPSCFIRTVQVRRHHRWVWRNVRVCNRYPVY